MNKIIMFTGVCALLYLASCTNKKEEKEEATKFSVTTPLRMDTSANKEYVSQIKSVRNIEIRAQEKGYLQNIYVDEGQHVKAGQLLFRIMPKMFEAELLKAQAETKASQIELENSKTLADKNIVSKNEVAMAQAKLDGAKAEVAVAKLHLSFTEIRAPFDGTIDRIPKKIGSLIDEGELLTSLSDNTQMFAYFNVSEPEYLSYETDIKDRGSNKVSLVLANSDVFKYSGEVQTVESEFDSETGNIAFRAKFPNPDQLLRNGETGKIQMTFPIKNALIIPQKATYEIQDKTFVFVVNNKGIVKARQIAIANDLNNLYVISGGISINDRILLEGVQKVKEDDKIKVKFISPKDVMKGLQLKAE